MRVVFPHIRGLNHFNNKLFSLVLNESLKDPPLLYIIVQRKLDFQNFDLELALVFQLFLLTNQHV